MTLYLHITYLLIPSLFLPDEVDGRVLFERATERWKALQEGRSIAIPKGGLGDIVMVPSVKEARSRHVLNSVRPFKQFSEEGVIWQDGTHSQVDSIIWCTGFSPALEHLRDLGIVELDGKVEVNGTRSIKEPNLWLVGWVMLLQRSLVLQERLAIRQSKSLKLSVYQESNKFRYKSF